MPPKLPDTQGNRQTPQGISATPNFSPTFDRNVYGQANIRSSDIGGNVAKAIQGVGESLVYGSEEIKRERERQEKSRLKKEVADARFRWAKAQIDIKRKMEEVEDYTKYESTYKDLAEESLKESVSVISEPGAQSAFMQDARLDLEYGAFEAYKVAQEKYGEKRIDEVARSIEEFKTKYFETGDPEKKGHIARGIRQKLDVLAEEFPDLKDEVREQKYDITKFTVSEILKKMPYQEQIKELTPNKDRDGIGDLLRVEDRIKISEAIKLTQKRISREGEAALENKGGRPKDPAVFGLKKISIDAGFDYYDPSSPIGYDASLIPNVIEAQRNAGIRDGHVSVLPSEKASSIAITLSGTREKDDFDGILNEFLGEMGPKYKNIALRDIKNTDILGADLRLYLEANTPEATEVQHAIFELRDEENRGKIMSLAKSMADNAEIKQLEEDVDKDLMPYIKANTMAFNTAAGAEDLRKSIQDVSKMFIVSTGGDLKKARQKSTEWLIPGKYSVVENSRHGTFIVPTRYLNAMGASIGKVETMAIRAKSDIIEEIKGKNNIDYPPMWGDSEATKDLYIQDIDSAVWASNESNTGVVLMYKGSPIYMDDGSRVEKSFSVLLQEYGGIKDEPVENPYEEASRRYLSPE